MLISATQLETFKTQYKCMERLQTLPFRVHNYWKHADSVIQRINHLISVTSQLPDGLIAGISLAGLAVLALMIALLVHIVQKLDMPELPRAQANHRNPQPHRETDHEPHRETHHEPHSVSGSGPLIRSHWRPRHLDYRFMDALYKIWSRPEHRQFKLPIRRVNGPRLF